MRIFYFLILFVVAVPNAFGQNTLPSPPPQNSVNPTPSVTPPNTLGTLFSDLEKQIIRETLGAINQTNSTDGETAAVNASTSGSDNNRNPESQATKENSERDDEVRKAKQKSKGKGRGKAKNKHKNKKMPPGLAKRNKLPPGLQKQLERNGKLPPGLQKRSLPDSLEAKLPPSQAGTERVIVDQDVVLIDKATNTVLDVIKDVLSK